MKISTPRFRIKSSNSNNPRTSKHTRNLTSTEKFCINEPETSGCCSHSKTFIDTKHKSFGIFFSQEISRLNKELDDWEIDNKNSMNFLTIYEMHLKYLQNLAFTAKTKDSMLYGALIRGIAGLSKAHKIAVEIKKNENKEPVKEKDIPKIFRENFSQTYTFKMNDDLPPDINRDILYVKNLAERMGKLKSGKIIQRLYELHEDLCGLQTDIPTPTRTPEPQEVTIGNAGHKLSMAVKIMRHQIKKSLSKHNIERIRLEKAVQTEALRGGYFSDPFKEKELEIDNLKRTIQHFETELADNKNTVCKVRQYCTDTERKHNDAQIEIIQMTNRLSYSEDTTKTLKQRVQTLTDKLSNKKRKLTDLRKQLNESKANLLSTVSSLKGTKNEYLNLSILCKIAEEKLIQIENTWCQATGKIFEYENISTVDICKKYNIYLSDEDLDINERLLKVPSQRLYSRRNTNILNSPKFSPKTPGRIQTKNEEESKSPYILVRPLVLKNHTIGNRLADLPENIQGAPIPEISSHDSIFIQKISAPISESGLPVIQERVSLEKEPSKVGSTSSKLSTIHSIEPLQFNDPENRWGNDKLVSSEKNLDIENPLRLTGSRRNLEKYRPKRRISTNLIKENLELSSPNSASSPSIRSRPVLTALIKEQDAIRSQTNFFTDKIKHAEENSKGIQCNLSKLQSSESDSSVEFVNVEVLNKETLETLENLCEEAGILKSMQKDNELDSMPQNYKLELLKALKGHEKNKCKEVCRHLKRANRIRSKARGIPYPIKTSTINSHFI